MFGACPNPSILYSLGVAVSLIEDTETLKQNTTTRVIYIKNLDFTYVIDCFLVRNNNRININKQKEKRTILIIIKVSTKTFPHNATLKMFI